MVSKQYWIPQWEHWLIAPWPYINYWHEDGSIGPETCYQTMYYWIYSRVSFCDGSFYGYSLLRPLSSRTEHCRNSSVHSVLSALLALCRCACVSSFSILVQFFWVDCDFSTHDAHQKDRKKKKSKQLTLHSFLMSSEPRPGPSSTRQTVIWLIFYSIICVIFYIPNSLN